MKSGGKEQDQDQKAIFMVDNIEKVEQDARQAENKVQKNKRLFIPQNYAFIYSAIKVLFLLMKTKLKSKTCT